MSDRLTELGETGDIEALSIALTKRFSGKKLSNSENALIQNSQYGTRVSYEMNPTNIQSGDYASEWAENIGTNRINPEEYSRIVKASQITQDTQGAEDSSVTADTAFDAPARAQDTETASAENQDSVQPEIDEHAAPDVQEAAVPAAQTLEEASEKYGEQADAMLQTYSEGQDVDEYDAAYKIAYDMGESGIPFDYVNRYAGTSYLTADQRKAAYEAGVSSAATSAGARDSEIKQGANGKTGWKQGVVSGEGVTGDDLQKAFNIPLGHPIGRPNHHFPAGQKLDGQGLSGAANDRIFHLFHVKIAIPRCTTPGDEPLLFPEGNRPGLRVHGIHDGQ